MYILFFDSFWMKHRSVWIVTGTCLLQIWAARIGADGASST